MQIHPLKPWNLRGAATEKTLVGPTIVANRPGDIRRCFPRLEMCYMAKGDCMWLFSCHHVFQDQLSSELVAVLPPGASIGTGTTVSYCSFFLDDFWGCGYFELLHGQIGMLHFNNMEMHCSSHFNMNFSKIPQSFLVNIYHHPEHQSIDPIATKYGPFLSIPPSKSMHLWLWQLNMWSLTMCRLYHVARSRHGGSKTDGRWRAWSVSNFYYVLVW